mmetsp:Transcript_49345/g.89235  ORF Transcript_49345/g.89235 Transcript_49345/m.89235 type:complete len:270 (-) Transcript_49345:344-1153(-)
MPTLSSRGCERMFCAYSATRLGCQRSSSSPKMVQNEGGLLACRSAPSALPSVLWLPQRRARMSASAAASAARMCWNCVRRWDWTTSTVSASFSAPVAAAGLPVELLELPSAMSGGTDPVSSPAGASARVRATTNSCRAVATLAASSSLAAYQLTATTSSRSALEYRCCSMDLSVCSNLLKRFSVVMCTAIRAMITSCTCEVDVASVIGLTDTCMSRWSSFIALEQTCDSYPSRHMCIASCFRGNAQVLSYVFSCCLMYLAIDSLFDSNS